MSTPTPAGPQQAPQTQQTPIPSIDITALANANQTYSVTIEPPDDKAARLNEERIDARMRRWMNGSIFVFGLVAVAVVFFVAGYKVLTGTPEQQKIAVPIISSIIASLLGYLVGKAVK